MEFYRCKQDGNLLFSNGNLGDDYEQISLSQLKDELREKGLMVVTSNPLIFEEFKNLSESLDRLKWSIANLSSIVSNTMMISNNNISEFYTSINNNVNSSKELNDNICSKLYELQTLVYNHIISCNTDDGNGNKKWEELI